MATTEEPLGVKSRFTKDLRQPAANKLLRAFLMRIHRRLDWYFNQDQTLLLKHNEQHKDWEIGEYSYGHPSKSPKVIHFGEDAKLKVGKFCSFAEEVRILFGGHHRADWVTTYPFSVLFDGAEDVEGLPHAKGDIIIGNDVWVCTGAMILAGVTIGDGAVIAARSVVTKDVPPYTIVAGNPARPVRKRFPDDIIEKLERIQWWDWPVEKIRQEFPLLLSANVEEFVEKHTAPADSAREDVPLMTP